MTGTAYPANCSAAQLRGNISSIEHIQDKILTKIANAMVSRGVLQGGAIHVDVTKQGELTFDIKRSARARVRSPAEFTAVSK